MYRLLGKNMIYWKKSNSNQHMEMEERGYEQSRRMLNELLKKKEEEEKETNKVLKVLAG